MPWYQFTPPPSPAVADPSNQNQYTSVGMNPPTCVGTESICAIQAQDSGGKPIILTNVNLLQEIIRAQHNHTNSANVLLKDL